MTAPRTITRVVLADGHAVFRRHLREFLEKELCLHVQAEASDGAEALRLVAQHRPDAVLVDMTTLAGNAPELARRIVESHPEVRVIALSLYADRQFAEAVLAAGASAFLAKDDAVDQLPRVLREIAGADRYIGAVRP